MEHAASHADYGEKRERGANVSYLEIEHAAIEILLSGDKPSIQSVRKALGDRGSPATILSGLKRFWRDLGLKAQGDPAALSRLPIEICEAVEAIWQRALALAAQGATNDQNAAREQLERLRIVSETREQSLIARERELELRERERERLLNETRDQLLGTLRALSRDREALAARDQRIAELERLLQDAREQVAAVTRAARKPAPKRRSPAKVAPRVRTAARKRRSIKRARRRR